MLKNISWFPINSILGLLQRLTEILRYEEFVEIFSLSLKLLSSTWNALLHTIQKWFCLDYYISIYITEKCICEVFIHTKKHNINCTVEMLSLTATECLNYKLEDN